MDALQSILFDINQLIPIVNHWLHLVSAVIWIGGLAFLVMSLTPTLQEVVPKELIKPIADGLHKRYNRIVGILLVVILFTGGINLHYVNRLLVSQTGEGIPHHTKYLMIFFVKLLLVLGILTLYLYNVIFKDDPKAEVSEEEKAERLREPIPFQRAALAIGLFIILCAAALKHLHQ
jgi:putative copper export protein